ncbi:MAG: hypothetical protein VZR02_04190 [Lachnospiraceae bacterium]|nr:hypothetical protein [Lachnospiraceae bacterium]
MLVDKKIDTYVDSVTRHLPMRMRGDAAREIRGLIDDMLKDYAGEDGPDILDVRDVLRDLGKPEELAQSYKEQRHIAVEKEKAAKGIFTETGRQRLHVIYMILTLVAIGLVGFGIVGLGMHIVSTMLPIFLGLVIALGVVMSRTFLIEGEEYLNDNQ